MGYYIFFYGVQPDKIRNVIGSGDKSIFDEILATETFELYADQDIPGTVSTRDALEHLIFSKSYNATSAHSYWYAFISICAFVGTPFSGAHEIKLGYETDLINTYLKTDFGIDLAIEETLLNENPIFNLPKVQDWPLHGILDKSELSGLKDRFLNINITDKKLEELLEEDEEKEMAYDGIRQIKENVLECLDDELQLFSFCH